MIVAGFNNLNLLVRVSLFERLEDFLKSRERTVEIRVIGDADDIVVICVFRESLVEVGHILFFTQLRLYDYLCFRTNFPACLDATLEILGKVVKGSTAV